MAISNSDPSLPLGNARYVIYVLRDPISGKDRYVGCTKRPLHDRLSAHISEGANPFRQSPKRVWIRGLTSHGLTPTIASIDEAIGQQAARGIEAWWLAHKRRQGDDLLNWDR